MTSRNSIASRREIYTIAHHSIFSQVLLGNTHNSYTKLYTQTFVYVCRYVFSAIMLLFHTLSVNILL